MIENSHDPRGLDPEEIRQFFQQYEPVSVPESTRDNIHVLLLEEVSQTLSPEASSRKPQFPLVGWLQQLFQRIPRFELGPSLAAAAMGAAAVLLLIGLYPYIRALTTPNIKIVVQDSTLMTNKDATVFIQSQNKRSLSLAPGETTNIEAGDKIIALSSNVAIEYAAGWTSTLKAGSVLDIENLSKGRSEVDIDLFLVNGEIFTAIDRELGFAGHIAIQTDSSLVEAVGTEFLVSTNTPDTSYLAVFTGSVQISNDAETALVTPDSQVVAIAGQSLQVSEQSEFSADLDRTEPYVMTKSGAVPLYAKPDVDAPSLAWLREADRLKLVGASDDLQWYVVCCIQDSVLSWVNADEVVPLSIYGPLPRFVRDAFDEVDNSSASTEADLSDSPTSETVEDSQSSSAVASPTLSDGNAQETAITSQTAPASHSASTEVIPSTSTPAVTFTPIPSSGAPASQRPVPPQLKPLLPYPADGADNGPAINLSTGADSQGAPTQEPFADEQDQGTPALEPGTDNQDSALGPSASEEQEPSNTSAAATATPPPNTPTSTPRPNRSTNTPTSTAVETPAPTALVVTATPAVIAPQPAAPTATDDPRPDTPVPTIPVPNTSTSAPADTSVPNNTSAPKNTPVPTSTPILTDTPEPATPLPTSTKLIIAPTTTAIPATNTPVPLQDTPTPPANTPVPTDTPILATATAVPTDTSVPSTNTPVPTNTLVSSGPTNTPTPRIVEPTPIPATTDTPTPNPKLTQLSEPPTQESPATTPPQTETPQNTPIPATPTDEPVIVFPTATPTPSQ